MKGIAKSKKSLMTLSRENLVEKSKILLSCITEPLTIGEYRLLDTYISRINPHKKSGTAVMFTKSEYQDLLGVKKVNDSALKNQLACLSKKQVDLAKYDPENNNSQRLLNLFSGAFLEDDETNGKVIFLKCNDDVKPLFFDFKESEYVKYQLKNILELRSVNSINVYNYLLGNAYRRTWEVTVDEFLNYALFLSDSNYYSDYHRLKSKVLDKALEEINSRTNLRADCKAGERTGKTGRAIATIIFTIKKLDDTIFLDEDGKNSESAESGGIGVETKATDGRKNSSEQKAQDDYTNSETDKPMSSDTTETEEMQIDTIREICCYEFTEEQFLTLFELISILNGEWLKKYTGEGNLIKAGYKYLGMRYNEMCARQPAKSRYGYLFTLISKDRNNTAETCEKPEKVRNKGKGQTPSPYDEYDTVRKPSFDVDELEKITIL